MKNVKQSGKPLHLDRQLKAGAYMRFHKHIYRIRNVQIAHQQVEVEDVGSMEVSTFHLTELFNLDPNEPSDLVIAGTFEQLQNEIMQLQPAFPLPPPAADIPETFLTMADRMICVVEAVDKLVEEERRLALLRGERFKRTQAIRRALSTIDVQCGLTAYYNYLGKYQRHNGNRTLMAAALRRATFGQLNMPAATLHFIDTIVMRYYGQSRMRPLTLYKLAESILERTGGRWIDPNKCIGEVPQDLIAALLNHRIPMQAILDNSEHILLLIKIELPSQSWLYQYLRWFESQPDEGRIAINSRYGEGTWEKENMSFDTFRHNATMPLQYVFADHHLIDVFTVDKETRTVVNRLYLTVLIDAYSTSILGIALLAESPCIESIQNALRHAIWPKRSHLDLGLAGEWLCFGIPIQLCLDNAWAHHSHSLEDLARTISRNGHYNNIELVFRPPYRARYGALIERFFGNLSGKVKEHLPGAIQSSHPRHIRNAVRDAALLGEDIWRFILEMILEHQNTPRKELDGMTPNEKWLEGVDDFGLPQIPPLNNEIERLFWRMSPETRQVRQKGIAFNGMHYWSSELAAAPRVDKSGKPVEYTIRTDVDDVSHIAIFINGTWAGDAFALELRNPDGLYRHVSVAERELAKALAVSEGRSTRNWLEYVNENIERNQKRKAEKKKIQRAPKMKPSRKPSPKDIQASDVAIETFTERRVTDVDARTERLARFGGKKR